MDDSYPLSPLSLLHRLKDSFHFAVSALLANLFSALFTFFFALVGTLPGALTGALIGQETESGFIRGAAVGAISGAVFSIEVFESSLLLWQSDESGIGCLLYLIDVIASLLSGRLVRERIGPAMLSAVQSQMGAVESQFQEQTDIFDTAISKGLTADSLNRIPKVRITDTSGEMVSCSVCLQEFQVGETEVCSSAIICSTYHVSTTGFAGVLLVPCAEVIFDFNLFLFFSSSL